MAGNGKSVVVDASVVMAWLAPDEKVVERVNSLLERSAAGEIDLMAPSLVRYEVWNGLRSLVLRRRIKAERLPEAVEKFQVLQINFYPMEDSGAEILRTAVNENLTAYDACYVYLAKKLKCKLESLDRKLEDKYDFSRNI